MKFVSKLMLYLAFTGLIPNLISAYSIKEATEQVKAGCDKALLFSKTHKKKLLALAVLLPISGLGLHGLNQDDEIKAPLWRKAIVSPLAGIAVLTKILLNRSEFDNPAYINNLLDFLEYSIEKLVGKK